MVMMLGALFFHTIMPPLALFHPLNEQLLLCVQTGKPLTGEDKKRKKSPPVSPELLQKKGAAEPGERWSQVSTQHAGVTINGSCNKL